VQCGSSSLTKPTESCKQGSSLSRLSVIGLKLQRTASRRNGDEEASSSSQASRRRPMFSHPYAAVGTTLKLVFAREQSGQGDRSVLYFVAV